MDLYFSPLACSMATRIALYEAGREANYLEVDPKTKVVQKDGSDFRDVNPLGLVPTLRTDDGAVLTENAAILQYVADRFPQAGIGAAAGIERSRLHQWLCFIGTELHKGLFVPLLDRKAVSDVKAYVIDKNLSRLDYLENYLTGRDYLLDHFSVADAARPCDLLAHAPGLPSATATKSRHTCYSHRSISGAKTILRPTMSDEQRMESRFSLEAWELAQIRRFQKP